MFYTVTQILQQSRNAFLVHLSWPQGFTGNQQNAAKVTLHDLGDYPRGHAVISVPLSTCSPDAPPWGTFSWKTYCEKPNPHAVLQGGTLVGSPSQAQPWRYPRLKTGYLSEEASQQIPVPSQRYLPREMLHTREQ